MKVTPSIVKEIFSAAGFEFIKHEPIGRLVFYYPEENRNVQFIYKNKTLTDVMDFIVRINYLRGKMCGADLVRVQMQTAIGIIQPTNPTP